MVLYSTASTKDMIRNRITSTVLQRRCAASHTGHTGSMLGSWVSDMFGVDGALSVNQYAVGHVVRSVFCCRCFALFLKLNTFSRVYTLSTTVLYCTVHRGGLGAHQTKVRLVKHTVATAKTTTASPTPVTKHKNDDSTKRTYQQ